ncbi:MAG: TolC family protein [Saprospiraceae bacterium]|nr:TolC family protein [Saprospiraceae bacterium]
MIAFLTGDPPSTTYIPVNELIRDTRSSDLENLTDRADFKAMQAAISSRIYSKKSVEQGIIPKIGIFGEFNVYDNSPLGLGNNAYLAGIQLQWDLFNGNARNYEAKKQKIEIEKAKAEMDLALDQAQLEINQAANEWMLSLEEISVSEKVVTLAEENRKIISDRFKQGLEKVTDVLNADLVYFDKKLKVMESISRHNKMIYKLEFLKASNKN